MASQIHPLYHQCHSELTNVTFSGMASTFDPAAQHDQPLLKIVAGLDRVAQAMRSSMWTTGKQLGLTPIQMQVLIFVRYHAAARRRAGYLAKEFDVTPATMSQAVGTLIKKELLEKKQLDTDARIQTLELTDAGRDTVDKIEDWASVLLPHLESLNTSDRDTVLSFLLNLIAALHKEGIISTTRQCTTCRFFRDSKEASQYYCKLLEQPLNKSTLRIDCPEHEAAG